MRPDAATARTALLVGILLLYGGVLVYAEGLRFEPRLDEKHFWETTESHFVGPFPPSLETLRSYPEIITPLSYVVWGQLHRLTDDGVLAGRMLNLWLSVAMVALIAISRRPEETSGPLAAAGLIAFPYFFPLSTHLYTDTIAVFFMLFGLHAYLRGRLVLSVVLFALAISTRQYLIQIPAALAAFEAWRFVGGERRLPELAAAVAAMASVLVWIALWGGLAPQAGVDAWTRQYPSPMFQPLDFIVGYGTYFLVGIGVYYVLPEMVLFRRWPDLAVVRTRGFAACAVGMAVLFAIDPPLPTADLPGGIFGRLARFVLPDGFEALRLLLFYGLALGTALRFMRRLDLPFFVVLVAGALSMKSQIPWEKYYFPTLAALWYLRSRPELGPARGGTPAPAVDAP